MKLFSQIFIVVLTGTYVSGAAVPKTESPIEGQYIIKLKPSVNIQKFDSQFKTSIASSDVSAQVLHQYSFGNYKGYAAKLSENFVEQLKSNPEVEYIIPDGIATINGQQDKPQSWGLTRVSQRTLDLSKPYNYPDSAGEGIEAWVVDTGINVSLPDFEGRAVWAENFSGDGKKEDGNGHGTHVAGTIGGKEYGVAKKVKLFAVKVLGSDGSGSYSGVIAGINYVAEKATKGKSVANMSLGGPTNKGLNDAVDAAVDAGVAFVVAAGNDNKDACNSSPAGASKVLTVGASDKTDKKASFSNFGKCVGIFGPGVDITSDWNDGNPKTISGTSMASPHVAGVAALYIGSGKFSSPKDLFEALKNRSTPNVIKGLDGNTANKLVYNGLDDTPPPTSTSPVPTSTSTPVPTSTPTKPVPTSTPTPTGKPPGDNPDLCEIFPIPVLCP